MYRLNSEFDSNLKFKHIISRGSAWYVIIIYNNPYKLTYR